MTLQYVVSASPSPGRAVRRLFWTEKGFKGPLVQVPQGPISQVNVVYSTQFPREVATEYVSPYEVPASDPGLALPAEKRTVWFSSTDRSIRAYNAEGRLFVEFLGAQQEGSDSRLFIGSEVVEVIREVQPALVRTDIGNKLLPPDGDPLLFGLPISGLLANPPFVHAQPLPSKNRVDYYAIATTNQPTGAPDQPSGEVVFYWKQAGDFDIQWPKYFSTYIISWPDYGDDAYTTYARAANNPADTTVKFDPDNHSAFVFQDDTTGHQATMKDALTFFTSVDSEDPDARALIRHINGESVWFERVHSRLDTTFDGFDAPVATDIGTRIEPPVGLTDSVGYIHEQSGTAYDVTAYRNPFLDGVINARSGAIIGVNALAGRNVLEVWWYKASTPPAGSGLRPTWWPAAVKRYALQWPAAPREIILAGNAGSGDLESFQATGTIYYQNDPDKQGFNPNDEHALMASGRAWALRDDLGTPETSEPYVLLSYTAPDRRPAMEVFRVLRETDTVKFQYDAVAGTLLQAPMPLPILPVPLKNGELANRQAFEAVAAAPNTNAPPHYNDYTYTDRKQSVWVYRGPHGEENASFGMQYYYRSLEGFYVPGLNAQPTAGSLMPYLRSPSSPASAGWQGASHGASDQALKVVFHPKWPDHAPQLRLGETLTLPKYGLPAVRGQTSMQVLYEQSLALNANDHSVALHDPTRAKIYLLNADDLDAMPGSVVSSSYRGRLYFPNLPPHLGDRFYFDPNQGEKGALVLLGEFKDETLGEDYLLLNVLSEADISALHGLCSSLDPKFADWTSAIDSLETVMETFVEDPYRAGTYIPVQPKTVEDLEEIWSWLVGFSWFDLEPGYAQNVKIDSSAYPISSGSVPISVTQLNLADDSDKASGSLVLGDVITIGTGTTHYTITSGDSDVSDGGTISFSPPLAVGIAAGDRPDVKVVESSIFAARAVAAKVTKDAKTVDADALPGLRSLVKDDQFRFSSGSTTYTVTAVQQLSPAGRIRVSFTPGLASEIGENAEPGLILTSESDSRSLTFTDLQEAGIDPSQIMSVWNWVKQNRKTILEMRRDFLTLAKTMGFTPWLKAQDRWYEVINEATHTRVSTDYGSFGLLLFDLFREPLKKRHDDLKASLATIYKEEDDRGRGVDELASISSPDTAVDSYALTASEGGEGWVVLMSGNGRAFTPEDEPVALHVIRVTAPLARGELKVIQPANPLSEKLTLQQSLDYAAAEQEYEFEWRYAPPVDGLPPVLYTFNPVTLLPSASGAQTWTYTSAAGAESSVTLPASVSAHSAGTPLQPVYARLSRSFTLSRVPLRLFLSAQAGPHDGLSVSINDSVVASWGFPGMADTATTSRPHPGLSPLAHLMEIPSSALQEDENVIEVLLHTTNDAGVVSTFDLKLEALEETDNSVNWIPVGTGPGETPGDMPGSVGGKNRHVIQGPGIFTMTDNYFICRYRAVNSTHAAYEVEGGWSKWTEPQLAEGWIKRALAGINPFEQRIKDLYSNSVNTDVSLLTQAGRRWEGDIALNLENINQFGLIEIYETILRRGRALSIEGTPPLNYGPANDALLLAAGYLNDLYMIVGNEAYADAANPTIAFNTDGGQFGDIATSLFAFKGQLANVLDEELSLLRGRDDFLPPGVRTAPVYNRLVWNYTRGIDSGEAVYALNYNIRDLNADGTANGVDAAAAYPQGHGDAYGHYLTALTNYYSLLRNGNFSWTPRSEAVLLLGKPVAVDYLDERKFATAAAAVARTSAQVLDLTYRKAYNPAAVDTPVWTHLGDGRNNSQTGVTREWGVDDWATRGGQGSFLHWVTANSTLPDVDPNPGHEGIQKIDRTTVPELTELVTQSEGIQRSLDTADARLNPLGLAGGALPFDISPTQVDAGKTHYEQIYDRAIDSLKNAVAAFNNAKSTTQLLRSQDESLAKQRDAIQAQERSFQAQLIDLYGTPYAEDIGPGKTYVQGYDGPDYYNYMYVDMPELFKNSSDDDLEGQEFTLNEGTDWNSVDLYDEKWKLEDESRTDEDKDLDGIPDWKENDLPTGGLGRSITYTVTSNGLFRKPEGYGRRARPGRIQDAISEMMMARLHLHNALEDYSEFGKQFRRLARNYHAAVFAHDDNRKLEVTNAALLGVNDLLQAAWETSVEIIETADLSSDDVVNALVAGFPRSVGLSNDVTAPARAATKAAAAGKKVISFGAKEVINGLMRAANVAMANLERTRAIEAGDIAWKAEHAQLLTDLKAGWEDLEDGTRVIDEALRAYDDAERKLRMLTHETQRIIDEREVFRKKASAIIQGYRTRDFGFRTFRNEALESYKSLFDLASRYTFLAARAYDYETGLADASGSSAANSFFQQIVQARALGVITADGRPQNAGSQGGDPGLTGALARMNADWSVVKTRLGFNNPDRYRTTFSLRREKERILPAAGGDVAWGDVLAAARMDNILDDDDVRRYCMQINSGDALSVPGYVIPFQTTISEGFNFFGQPLAGGDSTYSPTSFATKIRNVGIAFNGYVGMASPTSIGGDVEDAGGVSPEDPDLAFTDPNALSATPYVYLIAAGEDSMRSPAIGDQSTIRTWQVEDQAIPLPFDIGGADIGNNIFTPGQSLSETFTIRKHQAFRAVPDGTVFSSAPGFTNSRLIGRSMWNSRWKLVIPARTLLADPVKGMQIFQATVKDIKVHFETYSYSGN